MTIKHLVLCGGGPIGFTIYGCLKKLHDEKFWKLKDIESIYGCSIGVFIGIIIALDIDSEIIEKYFINRHWKKNFDFNNMNFFEILNKKGILDVKLWYDIFRPLFLIKSIDLNITLIEFYKLTNIEINISTTHMNLLNNHIINYKNNPDLKLMTALYMSSSIPILFKPYFENNNCYMDGGIVNNIPFYNCLMDKKCNTSEILTFVNSYIDSNDIKFDSNINYKNCNLNSMKWYNNNVIDRSNNITDSFNIITDSSRNIIDTSKNITDCSENIIDNSNNTISFFSKDFSSKDNLISFIFTIICKLINKFADMNIIDESIIENKINIRLTNEHFNIKYWVYIINDKKYIENIINYGKVKAELFLHNFKYKNNNIENK